jgi:YesN/AraC family two-component response regulator
MDRNMPKMDGITCAEKILKHHPTAKIIILSGYDEKGPDGIDGRIRCLVSGYLTKPVDTVELAQTLAGIFGQ